MNNELIEKLRQDVEKATYSFDGRAVVSAAIDEFEAALTQQQDDTHGFKNFHKNLCERFGYTHDECEWRRDQVSLIEHIALLTQQQEAEPVVYQGRMRPEWDRHHAWTPWESCSKGTYEDFKRVPINAGWIFEARALYLHPRKPAAQPQAAHARYAGSGESECPYPCGWKNLYSIIINKAAFFARATLDDDFPEEVRKAGIDLGQYAIDLTKHCMSPPPEQPQVPEGYQLVPIEPTQKMWDAGIAKQQEGYRMVAEESSVEIGAAIDDCIPCNIWSAMLEAAKEEWK